MGATSYAYIVEVRQCVSGNPLNLQHHYGARDIIHAFAKSICSAIVIAQLPLLHTDAFLMLHHNLLSGCIGVTQIV